MLKSTHFIYTIIFIVSLILFIPHTNHALSEQHTPTVEQIVSYFIDTGIVIGYPGGDLKLDGPITRHEAIVILYRYLLVLYESTSGFNQSFTFSDGNELPDYIPWDTPEGHWARTPVRQMIQDEFIQTGTNYQIRGEGYMTQGEVELIFKYSITRFFRELMNQTQDREKDAAIIWEMMSADNIELTTGRVLFAKKAGAEEITHYRNLYKPQSRKDFLICLHYLNIFIRDHIGLKPSTNN